MVGEKELEKRFKYHEPTEAKKIQHGAVRAIARDFASLVDELPTGREQSIAMTKIEEAMMWANAAIARSG